MARREEFLNGFLPKQYDKYPYTVDAPGYSKVKGETIPRRQVGLKELMSEPEPGIATTVSSLRVTSIYVTNCAIPS